MDSTKIQTISDYRLCDAAAVNLDLYGQRYPVIENEIARRGVSCAEHIAAVVSNCSRLQVLNSGVDSTEQGIIFTVRNDSDQAQTFRIRHEERQSRLFTIGPETTERFGITADPNVAELGEPIETVEGDGGIELLECRPVLASYRFNYRPQGQSSAGAAAPGATLQTRSTEQNMRRRATRSVNMRAGPGTTHAIVGSLRAGEEIAVLRTVGSWCEVATRSGGRAYVSCAFLSPPPNARPATGSGAADGSSGARPPAPFPPDYAAAYASYLSLLTPQQRAIPWLARMDGVVSTAAQPIRIGGISARWIGSCKPHECDTNQVIIFLMPDRRSVRAVLRMNSAQQLLGGAGVAEAACARALIDSGGSLRNCDRPAVRHRPRER